MTDPFATLGLPARPDLTDEQVRAAWRAIAAATHPDRPDGGDLPTYTNASTAYTLLRTPWARSEAWADLPPGRRTTPDRPVPIRPGYGDRAHAAAPAPGRPPAGSLARAARLPARIRHGRPARLAARLAAATTVAALAAVCGAGTPAITAVITGIATWLILTARGDLAPPPGR
jgi:hypothetical protein